MTCTVPTASPSAPYCLLFLLNMDLRKKWVMALFAILGFLAFLILFKGSAIPTYAIT